MHLCYRKPVIFSVAIKHVLCDNKTLVLEDSPPNCGATGSDSAQCSQAMKCPQGMNVMSAAFRVQRRQAHCRLFSHLCSCPSRHCCSQTRLPSRETRFAASLTSGAERGVSAVRLATTKLQGHPPGPRRL